MAKFKIVELKKTEHLLEAKRGVMLRTLMMAINKYNPEKIVIKRGENIRMAISAELISDAKFGGRILTKGPLQVVKDDGDK